MKTSINKLLSIPLLITALSAGATHAASSNEALQLLVNTPTNTGIANPLIAAPSPNIAAVARTLELRTKSLYVASYLQTGHGSE